MFGKNSNLSPTIFLTVFSNISRRQNNVTNSKSTRPTPKGIAPMDFKSCLYAWKTFQVFRQKMSNVFFKYFTSPKKCCKKHIKEPGIQPKAIFGHPKIANTKLQVELVKNQLTNQPIPNSLCVSPVTSLTSFSYSDIRDPVKIYIWKSKNSKHKTSS